MEENMELVDDEIGCDTLRHRSPAGSPPPNTPGVHLNRKESCCSDIVKEKEDPLVSDFLTKEARCMMMKADDQVQDFLEQTTMGKLFGRQSEEKSRECLKRELPKDEVVECEDGVSSLCSVCEKKKRIA